MLSKRILLLFFLLSSCTSFAFSQKVIHGTVRNKMTNETLPFANIQIKDTYLGTISNKDGEYSLKINKMPATVLVRYIGYISKEITITKKSPETQDIFLQPTILKMKSVVVTAEDPAVSIMREVIRRKQIWRKKLLTYKAEAYTRLGLENDTSIVFITESTSEIFWDVKRGPREVIKSKRMTANMKAEDMLIGSVYLPNFYDDDVEIQGTKVIGPTNPDALKYYKFKLIGQRSMDDKIVFDISAEPKGKLQPTFVGRLSVLDEVYAMIDVDLKPGKAVIMPFPIQEWNVYHKQQFNDFGQGIWLPLDARMDGDILISLPGIHFPRIKYSQVSRITDYSVNVVLPDSLYKEKKIISVDSLSIKSDTLLVARTGMIPLTSREKEAYATIDSTMTLEKAFQPTGFIAWLARLRVQTNEDEAQQKQDEKKRTEADSTKKEKGKKGKMKKIFSGISPQFVYNRVDAFHLGAKYNKWLGEKISLTLRGAYKTGLKRWSYGGNFTYFRGKHRSTAFSVGYFNNTAQRYHSDNYPVFYNTAMNLIGYEDYFDYFWNERFVAEFRHRIRFYNSRFSVSFHDEIHSSVPKSTDYNLIGRKLVQRINPGIQAGRLRSTVLKIDLGNEWVPWGIVGQKGVQLKIEYSSPDLFSSDFSFTRYQFALNWNIVTYLKRRLLPNMLYLRLVAGTATGDLPVQKFGALDVRSGSFSPFGVFRTVGVRPFEGEKYLALYWEHNFRTIPFELLGIDYLVKNGIGLIVHGASGRTWISAKTRKRMHYIPNELNDYYHEVGLSVSGIFGFMRLDVTKPINRPGVYLGFGIARIF